MEGAVSLLSPPYCHTGTKPCSHTSSQVPQGCSYNVTAIFILINAVFRIHFDITRKFLTSSCSCFLAFSWKLTTCTFQTTTAIPYTGTDSSAFGFSAISCSSILHRYSKCWHLNLLTAILPLQVLNSGEKYTIKDKLNTPTTKFTLPTASHTYWITNLVSKCLTINVAFKNKSNKENRQKHDNQTLENTNYFSAIIWWTSLEEDLWVSPRLPIMSGKLFTFFAGYIVGNWSCNPAPFLPLLLWTRWNRLVTSTRHKICPRATFLVMWDWVHAGTACHEERHHVVWGQLTAQDMLG